MPPRKVWSLMVTAFAFALPASAQASVLYSQPDGASVDSYPSDDYAGTPSASLQLADDFTIPPGQTWQISQLDVIGVRDTFPQPPPSIVNAFLYANSGTLPGAELFRQAGVSAAGAPNYSVPLNGAPPLSSGTYWASIQQSGAGFMVPGWYWVERTVQSGSPAAVRNPGGGTTPGCTDWKARNVCTMANPAPDQLFSLSGTATSNQLTFGKLKRNAKKGTARLTVNAPGPGTLDLSGKGVVPRRSGHLPWISRVKRTVDAAGVVKLPIKARGKAKRKLNRRGKVTLKATVTYTSTGASPRSQNKKLRLKKRLP